MGIFNADIITFLYIALGLGYLALVGLYLYATYKEGEKDKSGTVIFNEKQINYITIIIIYTIMAFLYFIISSYHKEHHIEVEKFIHPVIKTT